MTKAMRFMAMVIALSMFGVFISSQFACAASEISRDGRFVAYDDGTVLDTKTSLVWAAKDNGSNINWFNAKAYCENYRGGGYTDWRMPTIVELQSLYDGRRLQNADCGGAPVHVATELIKFTCRYAWSSERQGGEFALFFFDRGYSRFYPQSYDGLRILPVRLGK